MIEPSLRLRRAILIHDTLLVRRILHSHPSLLQNPDPSPLGLSNTSLHLAASLGYHSIVKVLLALGHDTVPPSSSSTNGNNGITGSLNGNNAAAASAAGAPPPPEIEVDIGKLFPGSAPTPPKTSLNESHQTPLHLAALAGHAEIVHLLCVECPSSIERRDIQGRDAIMLASQNGHDTVVQILLTFWPGGPEAAFGLMTNGKGVGGGGGGGKGNGVGDGADVDGNTALHFASMNGHLLVLRTLLAAGADSERRNCWSWRGVDYSATVAAEVYFKTLVADNERRKQVRQEVTEKRKGGGVRVVEKEL